MKFFLTFILTFTYLTALEVGNGQSIIIPLRAYEGHLRFQDRNYTIIQHPTQPSQGIVILPIDYHTQPQSITLHWNRITYSEDLNLTIEAIAYPAETLSVDPTKVTPPPEAQARIDAEKAEAEIIYNHYTPHRYWTGPFIRPIDSITTSSYGSTRTYNGFFKNYHSGIDFRALTPLPILASNDGVVVLAKDRYISGGTIIIDHGEGLYTCYFHLSEYRVKVGDKVAKGQEIALSGATGRITGPHLHFGVMIHGVQSDPLHLLNQINRLFDPALSL